jgi:hypothetical protein
LRLLKGRNFGFGAIAVTTLGFALFGSVYILPTYHGVSDAAVTHHQAVIALGTAVKHQALVTGFSDTFAVVGAVLALAAAAAVISLTRRAKGAVAH